MANPVDKGYQDLGKAVIEQAAQDYINTKLTMEKCFDKLDELIEFFKGGTCELYYFDGHADGEKILKNLDLIVEKKYQSWKKRREKEAAKEEAG